jgi:hypothetical protein
MKYIKKFESFNPSGVDDGPSEGIPSYNPKIRKEVVDFVDDLSPNRKLLIFKWFGMDEPSLDDEDFDNKIEKAKEILIKYFEMNPNKSINTIDMDNFKIPYKMGDGIPRVQNIGGSSHTNSFRIGQ